MVTLQLNGFDPLHEFKGIKRALQDKENEL